MNRKSICLVGCLSLILSLSGCFHYAESTAEMSRNDESGWSTIATTEQSADLLTTDVTSEDSHDVDLGNENIQFGMAINMYEADTNHSTGRSMGYQIAIHEDKIVDTYVDLYVQSNFEDTIPVTIWVIADGKFIPFTVNNEAETTEYQLDASTNASTRISLSFNGEPTFRFITVVADVFSTHIPSSNFMSYSGIISYTLLNTCCTQLDTEPVVSAGDYVPVSPCNENIGCGIDTTPINISAQRANCVNKSDTLEISASQKELWIKFNQDQTNSDSNPLREYFSVFVLCDGQPQPIFDGQYTYLVHTPAKSTDLSSDRAFCYQIPKNMIPNQGTHIYQVVAVPFYFTGAASEIKTANGVFPISSPKIRVQIT